MSSPGAALKHTLSSLMKQKQPKNLTRNRTALTISMKDLDPIFQTAGQKHGLEVWRIEKMNVVPVPKSLHGKFFMEGSYIVLKTTALKNGSLQHDIHYWFGRDTSQDESRTAVTKAVELAATLGGNAVLYREIQENETAKFLSYFKPCIIPLQRGATSGFSNTEVNERELVTRLFVCKGRHAVHVKEVPLARTSLNHDDIFILDTKSKIFQFSGSNSSVQERARAMEVVQYIRDTYHGGKCAVAAVDDGKLMSDAEAGEFWALFGGFAPLPRKPLSEETRKSVPFNTEVFCLYKGQTTILDVENLTREMLETNKCYILDFGVEIFVWLGRETSLDERKRAMTEELFLDHNRWKCLVTQVMEGFENVAFRSKFDKWPRKVELSISEEGRGKVAAILKRQGLVGKGTPKATPVKEEPKSHIDCTGHLEVWRVNNNDKSLLPFAESFKFYSGDCYIFQYIYPGEDGDECLIGTWFGTKSIEEERAVALSHASKMLESLKFQAAQARLYEGKEPNEFFSIFQNVIVFKGGVSSGYRSFIEQNSSVDETYSAQGVALFRIQGSGPDNMQAIQVDPVASSLNSSYCYILHDGDKVFTWIGTLSTVIDQDLAERELDVIKPNHQSKNLKEGSEIEKFWKLLGGKSEYPSQKIERDHESDPHLFSCTLSKGMLKVEEIFNYTQDDLMAEDIYVLDCHSFIFIWFGQQVDVKYREQAFSIGEKFIELDVLMEKLSRETPIYVVTEGSEPMFFTQLFTWDYAKSAMQGNSFEKKLTIVKNGVKPSYKPKRRTVTLAGRSGTPENSQRARSMSFSPDRIRVRGRSPAFNALAANFENLNSRNLSMPPPPVKKLNPRSPSPDPLKPPPKSAGIAALSSTFERPKQNLIPKSIKVAEVKPKPEEAVASRETNASTGGSATNGIVTSPATQEGNGANSEGGFPVYPYERLKTSSTDPPTDIDITRREIYLSPGEFEEKFKMAREVFLLLPKWKQNRLKISLQLF